MNGLDQAVADYLSIRRAFGFKLEKHAKLLPRFVAFLADPGATSVTNELSLAWATQSADADPIVWKNRLTIVRGFAKYLATLDPQTEVPPKGLVVARPHSNYRAEPYLYSDQDVEALMAAARGLRPLKAVTYETLIGLLVVTGCRIGELLRCRRDDVDPEHRVLVISDSKFGKSREVPLHQSTLEALVAYLRRRDQLFPTATTNLFISTAGGRLTYKSVQPVFARLAKQAGLEPRSDRCRPRLHDFRHGFAVHQLLEWNRSGADVAALLPLLSTVLGHVDPGSTYWYLEAVPELLAFAASRAEKTLEILR